MHLASANAHYGPDATQITPSCTSPFERPFQELQHLMFSMQSFSATAMEYVHNGYETH